MQLQLLSLLSISLALNAASGLRLPQLKVLALGDSITFGCGSDAAAPDWFACCNSLSGGYRAPLWAALNGSAINASILMVGTESNGPSWVPAEQRAHEGHPGWTITQIRGLQPKWEQLTPDVVLLMAGTNDVGQGHLNATMTADMDLLLSSLNSTLPNARVFVTTLLNLPDSIHPDFAPTILYYNTVTLPQLVGKYRGMTLVDINGATGMCFGPESPLVNLCAVCNGKCGGYNPNSCPPNGYSYCHPTGAGYSLVAGVWANSLLPTLAEMAESRRVD